MNWDAIGAIGEIVGALAVVVSLVYLAVQVRAQIAESRETTTQLVAESFRRSGNIIAGDPNMAEIFIKARETESGLTEAELVQLYGGIAQTFRFWEEAHRLYKRDRIDADMWDGMQKQFAAAMATGPVFQRVWEARRDYYNRDFQVYVDSLDQIEPLRWSDAGN